MSKSKVMPWLRLYTEIIDDWKIRSLAFEDRWHYVAILCLKRAGELDKGEIDLRMMSLKLGVHGQDLEGIQNRLIDACLISENWQPLAWDERQPISDRDETNPVRQKRYREKRKQENLAKTEGYGIVTDSNALRNGEVTQRNGEVTPLDIDIDKDKEEEGAHAPLSGKPDDNPVLEEPFEDPKKKTIAAAAEVIEYLNQKRGTEYNSKARTTLEKPIARLNAGMTVDELKQIVDYKFEEWKGTKHEKYLQPSTLFSPKALEYLEAAKLAGRPNHSKRKTLAEACR